jgi:hypothetical protein
LRSEPFVDLLGIEEAHLSDLQTRHPVIRYPGMQSALADAEIGGNFSRGRIAVISNPDVIVLLPCFCDVALSPPGLVSMFMYIGHCPKYY